MKNISRRTLMQNLFLTTAGIGLSKFVWANELMSKETIPLEQKFIEPFYLPPQNPLQPGPGGIDIRTWVRSKKTNGQFSCVETAVAPRTMGPAPHLHKNLDELMFVLEGTATVMVNGKIEEIKAGGWHFRPRGIEHTFWNNKEKTLRFVDMYFNQNFEDFLEELFHKIIPEMVSKNLSPQDPSIATQMKNLDKRFGVITFHEKRQPIIDKYHLKG